MSAYPVNIVIDVSYAFVYNGTSVVSGTPTYTCTAMDTDISNNNELNGYSFGSLTNINGGCVTINNISTCTNNYNVLVTLNSISSTIDINYTSSINNSNNQLVTPTSTYPLEISWVNDESYNVQVYNFANECTNSGSITEPTFDCSANYNSSTQINITTVVSNTCGATYTCSTNTSVLPDVAPTTYTTTFTCTPSITNEPIIITVYSYAQDYYYQYCLVETPTTITGIQYMPTQITISNVGANFEELISTLVMASVLNGNILSSSNVGQNTTQISSISTAMIMSNLYAIASYLQTNT
jgi:hypothetical protein